MTSPDDPFGRAAAQAAKARVQDLFGADSRVQGVGIARRSGTYGVKVNVVSEQDVPDLPDAVDGVPVLVAAVGRISARAS
ncbi:hypothetical protein [Kineococcus glutinatus]|uniref:Uncharacterized protein n=1 Tax=Kineococcus glutinatus TaxID=1070872 RepID=A0ABP9HBX3_9ACTN